MMELTFCILLLVSLVKSGVYKLVWSVSIYGVAGDVSIGEVIGDLLLLLVCKHIKTNTVKMPMLHLLIP